MAFLSLAALGACLLVVAVEDVRRRRIPNGMVLILLALALHRLIVFGEAGLLLPHLALAAAMSGLFLAAYVAGLMGGGDTKLLAVAILWVGPRSAVLFAILLFAGAVVVAAVLWARALAAGRPVRGHVIPFGPPIAFAWMTTALLTGAP